MLPSNRLCELILLCFLAWMAAWKREINLKKRRVIQYSWFDYTILIMHRFQEKLVLELMQRLPKSVLHSHCFFVNGLLYRPSIISTWPVSNKDNFLAFFQWRSRLLISFCLCTASLSPLCLTNSVSFSSPFLQNTYPPYSLDAQRSSLS